MTRSELEDSPTTDRGTAGPVPSVRAANEASRPVHRSETGCEAVPRPKGTAQESEKTADPAPQPDAIHSSYLPASLRRRVPRCGHHRQNDEVEFSAGDWFNRLDRVKWQDRSDPVGEANHGSPVLARHPCGSRP